MTMNYVFCQCLPHIRMQNDMYPHGYSHALRIEFRMFSSTLILHSIEFLILNKLKEYFKRTFKNAISLLY